MKYIFKKFNLLTLLLVLALTLVACVDKDDSGSLDTESDEDRQDIKSISIFIPEYEDKSFKSLYDSSIEDFRSENPDINVEIITAKWKDENTKILSLIQANETPDVIISGSRSLRQFSELGAITKLDGFMTDEFKEKRVEEVLETARINGNQYGIPLGFSSRALYYRSDLIKTPPTNWDELLETAKKVREEHADIYGFAIPTDLISGTDELLNFIYQNGGTVTDQEGNIKINTKENIETLEYLKEFRDADLIPDPIGTERGDQATMFKNGDLAMFISGPWESEVLYESAERFPYGVTKLPQGKIQAVTIVTDSFSISETSENKESAWKLIEFMGQFKHQNVYDEAIGYFPILKEEQEEERYRDEFLKPFESMIRHGISEPHLPVWETFNKEFTESVQKVLTDKASPKEALDSAQEALTK